MGLILKEKGAIVAWAVFQSSAEIHTAAYCCVTKGTPKVFLFLLKRTKCYVQLVLWVEFGISFLSCRWVQCDLLFDICRDSC